MEARTHGRHGRPSANGERRDDAARMYAGVAALDLGGNPLTDPRLLAALKKSDTRNLDATGTDPWAEVSPIGPRCLSLGDNGVDDRSALEGLGKLRASSSPIGLETSE